MRGGKSSSCGTAYGKELVLPRLEEFVHKPDVLPAVSNGEIGSGIERRPVRPGVERVANGHVGDSTLRTVGVPVKADVSFRPQDEEVAS